MTRYEKLLLLLLVSLAACLFLINLCLQSKHSVSLKLVADKKIHAVS